MLLTDGCRLDRRKPHTARMNAQDYGNKQQPTKSQCPMPAWPEINPVAVRRPLPTPPPPFSGVSAEGRCSLHGAAPDAISLQL